MYFCHLLEACWKVPEENEVLNILNQFRKVLECVFLMTCFLKLCCIANAYFCLYNLVLRIGLDCGIGQELLQITETYFHLYIYNVNLVTTLVLHLWYLLLIHLLGPLWKSLIAIFGMLHLLYGMNCSLNFVSLIRCCLLYLYLLSHMAVHHLHYLHHHHFYFLLLVQSFIRTLRLVSLANLFHHRPVLHLLDWFRGFSDYLVFFILFNGRICLHGVLD